MAELKFLDTVRVTADNIKADTKTYVSRVYKRANTLFTEASRLHKSLLYSQNCMN